MTKHLSTGSQRKTAEQAECRKGQEERKDEEEACGTVDQEEHLLKLKGESVGDEKDVGLGESKCQLLE